MDGKPASYCPTGCGITKGLDKESKIFEECRLLGHVVRIFAKKDEVYTCYNMYNGSDAILWQ